MGLCTCSLSTLPRHCSRSKPPVYASTAALARHWSCSKPPVYAGTAFPLGFLVETPHLCPSWLVFTVNLIWVSWKEKISNEDFPWSNWPMTMSVRELSLLMIDVRGPSPLWAAPSLGNCCLSYESRKLNMRETTGCQAEFLLVSASVPTWIPVDSLSDGLWPRSVSQMGPFQR